MSTESLDILGEVRTRTQNTEQESLLGEKERIEQHITNLKRYLELPYIFALPPTKDKLMPSDPNYQNYMVRSNVNNGPFREINAVLEDNLINISDAQRYMLKECREFISAFNIMGRNILPTQE